MRIYLSHHKAQETLAHRLESSLLGDGHEVFRRTRSLPPGRTENDRVRRGIERSHLFVFLLSPAAVEQGSPARFELEAARQRWRSPKRHILPVLVEAVPKDDLPTSLHGFKLLAPQGDLGADIYFAAEVMTRARRRRQVLTGLGYVAALGLLVLAVQAALWLAGERPADAPRFELRSGSIGSSLVWGEQAVFELAPLRPDADLSYSCTVEQTENPNIARVEHDPLCERIVVEAAYRPFVDASGTPYQIGYAHPENDWLPLVVFDGSGREMWRARIPLMLMNTSQDSYTFHGLPLTQGKDPSIMREHSLAPGVEYPFEIRFAGRPLPSGVECEHQKVPQLPGMASLRVTKTDACAFSLVAQNGMSPHLMPAPFQVTHPETGFRADLFLQAKISGDAENLPGSQAFDDFSDLVDRVSEQLLEEMAKEP